VITPLSRAHSRARGVLRRLCSTEPAYLLYVRLERGPGRARITIREIDRDVDGALMLDRSDPRSESAMHLDAIEQLRF
jgi:hypothetical protein